MIQRARFQSFKSLRDVSIEFDSRLTVLVGPNGSGKTSVLEGLKFSLDLGGAVDSSQYSLNRLTGYASSWGSWEGVRLDVAGRCPVGEYQLALQEPTGQEWGMSVTVSTTAGRLQVSVSSPRSGSGLRNFASMHATPKVQVEVRAVVDRATLFRLSPSKLAKPTLTKVADYPPSVGEDGSQLVSTLIYLQKKHPARFAAILEAYRQVIPAVRGIRFGEAPDEQTGYYAPVILVDFDQAQGIPANHLSSGTLFALGLLTVALGPDSPNVLLVDELDHGFHPKAQAELITVLQRVVDTNPNLQIVGTTHSVYLLHHLQVNQVRLMYTQPDGSATCGRLDNHPDYERWKDHMTPGEFWTHVGEDWLLKKPVPAAA